MYAGDRHARHWLHFHPPGIFVGPDPDLSYFFFCFSSHSFALACSLSIIPK